MVNMCPFIYNVTKETYFNVGGLNRYKGSKRIQKKYSNIVETCWK